MQFSLGKCFLGLLLTGALTAAVLADAPLERLRAVSILPPLDLAKLQRGEIVVERGPVGQFPRGVHLQSCYFVRAPMDVVGNALLHWDPVKNRDPDVRLYRAYEMPGSPNDFQNLRLDTAFGGDNWLLVRSAQVGRGEAVPDLHLTKEETTLLGQKAPNEAWREILLGRSRALARGGLASVAPYRSGENISPGSEFRGLLTLDPKAAQHFQPILKTRPMAAGGKVPSETVAYWDATKVRDHLTLQLGLLAAQKNADSWQLIGCTYYPSDTYYMSLDLTQLWPVEGATLVWQVGFVSAPFRTYLGGVDRFVAGKLMTEETIATIKTFRAAVEKSR